MEIIQINSLSLSEFQKMLDTAIESAISIAIANFLTAKQDPYEEITIGAIAEMWSCSKKTVSRRIKYHRVPTTKLGRDTSVKYKYLEILKKPISRF